MKGKISSFSIIILFIALSLLGIYFLPRLSVKLHPSYTLPSLSVSFNMWGSSPLVVEQSVTSKLEGVMNRIEGVSSVSSYSGKGYGSVTIQFDKSIDADMVRFEASSAIKQLWPELPENVTYPSIRMNRPDDNEDAEKPLLSYTMMAPMNPDDIVKVGEDKIKTPVSLIKGVSSVRMNGGDDKEWVIEYKRSVWEKYGITPSDIGNAIRLSFSESEPQLASMYDEEGNEKIIRLGFMQNPEKIFEPENIIVKDVAGHKIYLNQVADIKHQKVERTSYYRINGMNLVNMTISAEANANQIELGDKIKKEIEEITKTLPPGYELRKDYDATTYLKKELDTIYFRTTLTLLILLVFTLLISRSLKYLILIASSLTVNMLLAFIIYYFLKLEIQLYSLAGITISLSLVIDNIIVMTEHVIHKGNRKVILSIIAATLTSIAALGSIFFMDENMRLNLQDFALVIVVNLAMSVIISLFLVPALIERISLKSKSGRFDIKMKRLNIHFNRGYIASVLFVRRFRWVIFTIIILGFGTPVFFLPIKLDETTFGNKIYNSTIGSRFYQENLKKHLNVALGGTWRLFSEKVGQGRYWSDRGETILTANISMPSGSSITQMNKVIEETERFISTYSGVRQFQTSVSNSQRARISIYFNKKGEGEGLPWRLKDNLTRKAIEFDGVSFAIYGVGHGFDNNLRESAGSYRVECKGYNYDELIRYTNLFKERLLANRRINEVMVDSRFSYYKTDYKEFCFDINDFELARRGMSNYRMYGMMNDRYVNKRNVAYIPSGNKWESVSLLSDAADKDDFWGLKNNLYLSDGAMISNLANIELSSSAKEIAKKDQQYLLCLQYEYVGTSQQGGRVLKRELEAFNKELPLGYILNSVDRGWWEKEDEMSKYLLLLVIMVVIFVICSILFNSLKQPLIIISIIPISFIGLFLTFYLFDLGFDQGGFASFILLCGITVNSAIYLLDEYNNIAKEKRFENIPSEKRNAYIFMKAFNLKIVSIFLTIISTVIGFIPFMIGNREPFWFSLSVGTMGGLLFSLIGLFIYFPLLMVKRKRK